ncbi:hypothetical protein [Nocardia arthritidis]|uniref:Uncharacterized protein n=1 Tax=Nocardia arthritidis TaxID=228602 RepID=A0A6G9YP94_9NOCA|nr:hypothetical protein [Nocardia arthritidis]QIS14743.1 hypothetical protein F5544_34550 [Nocardia arthritidis]
MRHTDDQLAARWWQWAMSIPNAKNPVRDESGEYAAEGQPEDVWFLAGTFGGKVSRRCAVPHGRPLFFPTFNMFQRVKGFSLFGSQVPVAPAATGHAELNGVSLPVRLVANRTPFGVTAAAGGPFGVTGRFKATAWGLWCRLDDLSRGDYVLTFGGEYEPGGFWVEAAYQLEIV